MTKRQLQCRCRERAPLRSFTSRAIMIWLARNRIAPVQRPGRVVAAPILPIDRWTLESYGFTNGKDGYYRTVADPQKETANDG